MKPDIKLQASVKNEPIYYISTMKDNIWTLLNTSSFDFRFTTLQLGNGINLSTLFSKKERGRVANT